MPRKSSLRPELRDWLSHTVYPKLSHDQVFGSLPGYTQAEYSETRYADCPRCHRKGKFYMIAGWPTGQSDSCGVTITWWAFAKYDRTEPEAITAMAALAGVEPLADAAEPPPADDTIFHVGAPPARSPFSPFPTVWRRQGPHSSLPPEGGGRKAG